MFSNPRSTSAALLLVAALLASGCSARKVAVNALGNALAAGGDTYATDDDPELVAAAVPFGLKTIEALLAESPRHEGLLLAAASGFTQYAFAFVQAEADYVEEKDLARATGLRARARRLYARALGYGLRGLEARHPGFEAGLRDDALRGKTLAATTKADVPLLYWTGAAWGAAISLSKENAELTADQGLAEALERRALALDEAFGQGTIHDFFIAFEGGRPAAAGGSVERARKHLERAVALSSGRRAAPYVSFAESVSVGAQNRAEFEEMLEKALAVDPDAVPELRLANTVSQRRAAWLLARADELFLE
ncbi:MAG: TRAP transporter TatT component family protein [Thermoanaerobaculia bacterium]|nr:TRAP transporter TatT component family protein [Thermoanaerobaculia bacterium]